MVRLVDIARQAGVSVMTVSRVMRDTPDISEATKAKVLAIAKQLGYLPDAMARSLRTRSTRLLGALVPTVTDRVVGPALQTIGEYVQQLGYDLIVAQSFDRPELEESCLHRLLARRIEGLFLVPVGPAAVAAQHHVHLRRRQVPAVVLGYGPAMASDESLHAVGADETAASRLVTDHLIGLGHRQIVFLAGPSLSASARARFDGYRQALRSSGIDLDERLVFGAGLTMADGVRAVERMLSESVRATAVQAVNDMVAIGAMDGLVKRGCSVPGDWSLAGFGDLPLSGFGRIPLTTVGEPKHQLGKAAVQVMASLLRGESPVSVLLPTELIVRSSTGPPNVQAPATTCPVHQEGKALNCPGPRLQ